MKKLDEINTSTSCLNKAADDEPLFVLRAKDLLAPIVVAYWAELASRSGLHEDEKTLEAIRLARDMKMWKRARTRGRVAGGGR